MHILSWNTDPQRLRQTSVGREHLIGNALESLNGSMRRKSKQHLLFIGPEGIGKTHLLSRIEADLERDDPLNARTVVARFPDMPPQMRTYPDFLIELCRCLSDVLDGEPIWGELLAATQTETDAARIIDRIVPVIREANRRNGRTLIVMLERLDALLSWCPPYSASLRKLLMAHNGCLLVGTAPVHFQGITDPAEPLYGFFDVQIVRPLSDTEIIEVIQRNLAWDGCADRLDFLLNEQPTELESLCNKLGGNPQLALILASLIACASPRQSQDLLPLLLDKATPIYRGWLKRLAPNQRALLECLASLPPQDRSPATIATRMRMSQQKASSFLKRLSDAHFLCAAEHPEDGRSRLYRFRDELFRIWLATGISPNAGNAH